MAAVRNHQPPCIEENKLKSTSVGGRQWERLPASRLCCLSEETELNIGGFPGGVHAAFKKDRSRLFG